VLIWESLRKLEQVLEDFRKMEEILTASQVAALLKVHLRTVYTLARKGSIPARKFGGGWRFSKNAILKMVANEEGDLSMYRGKGLNEGH